MSEKREARDRALPGFRITGKKGFHVTFENGWTVSVQFGPGNYCENRELHIAHDEELAGQRGSATAETAVWGPDGEFRDMGGGDTVQGWQTPEQVFALLQFAANGGKPSAGRGDDSRRLRTLYDLLPFAERMRFGGDFSEFCGGLDAATVSGTPSRRLPHDPNKESK